MAKNSANILLRAKIDIAKSMPDIRKQVDEISKKLETKPVKLKAKLDVHLKDILPQLKLISQRLEKHPIKIKVNIDVHGSALNIKKQLQEVYKTVDDFNKKYGRQLRQMQEQAQRAGKSVSGSMSSVVPTNGLMGGFNIKQYASQLKEAERMLKQTFGKGLFSSFETKDAEGNLQGFIAQLEKANGVVQRVRYSWNKDLGMFQVIDQQTVTNTEKNVQKSINALKELEREILKLGRSGARFWSEYNKLQRQGERGTLNPSLVADLKRRIKDEQVLLQQIAKENKFLNEQKKLIEDIKKVSLERTKLKNKEAYKPLIDKAYDAKTSEELKAIRVEMEKMLNAHKREEAQQKEHIKLTKERIKLERELKRLEAQTPTMDDPNRRLQKYYIDEAKAVVKLIKTYDDLEYARQRVNSLKNSKWMDDDQRKARKLLEDLKAVGEQLKATGHSMAQFNRDIARLDPTGTGRNLNTKDIEMKLDAYTRMLKRKKAEIRNAEKEIRLGEDITQAVNKKFGSGGIVQLENLIKAKDIQGLQEFIGKIYGAKVATVSLKNDGVDPTGRAVTKLVTTFESAGKSARRVTLTMAEGTKTLRQASEEMVYNANRNLGVFEQLKIAMARVPVWMTATTAFFGSINAVQAMVDQILQLDKALTELRRVADPSLSIDTLFQGAVKLSAELGNNIHDIMASLNDFARTFGDFNERQLLTITKTATLMSNVSDLTAQEAAENLVGTMNAFNITAEDSIHIVDALNEVDNNYAISTKQLAEALSKSSSTAKTFGVTLEENIGHITAIGAVTMESGSIIGNALKTIYSRITTMKDAKKALQSVGVAITEIGKDGQAQVRPVADILDDLAQRWDRLTDAQKQDIAVKVAGRYQLSRFLALMNNYQMALDATKTATYSQGSALRENAKYMQSFEARINKLRNAFTELSSAVGDAVLSDGMMAVISGLGALAKVAITVTQNIGALPVVFGAVAAVLMRMDVFGKVKNALAEGLAAFNTEMKRTMETTGGIRGALAGASAGFGALATSIRGAEGATKGFKIAWRSMLAETLIGAAFVALGIAIEKLTSYMAEQQRKAEELEKVNANMVKAYRQHGNSVESLIARYDELKNKQNKSVQEQEEFDRIQKDLASSFPTIVEYVDANGKAHLKSTDAIKKEVEAVAQLSQEQAKLAEIDYASKVEEQAQAYQEVLDKIEDLKDKQKELEESDGQLKTSAGLMANLGLTDQMFNDNRRAIQQTKVDIMMAEAEKTEAIKKTIKVIQEQALAYLEAHGKLSSLGDAQQAVIEKFIQANENMLRGAKSADEYKVKMGELFNLGTTVGDVFARAFQQMSAGIGDDPLQLDKIKQQLSDIAKALPEDFFDLNKHGSIDQVAQDLQKVIDVSNQIASGATNWKQLEDELHNAGLEGNQAGAFIARLAREHDNAALRAQAQAQGIEEVTGALEDLNQKTLDTIEVTESLFGYNSKDLQALQSHIQSLQVLKQLYGENATKTEAWNNSLSELADYLGVSESEIASNLNHYNLVIDALSKLKYKTDDYGRTILDTSELNKRQKSVLQDVIRLLRDKGVQVDILTGETHQLVAGEQKVKSASEDMKQGLQGVNSVVFDNAKNQLSGLGNQADTTKSKVEQLQSKFLTNTINSPHLLNLMSQYKNLGSTLDTTASKAQTTNKAVSNVAQQGGATAAQVNQQMQGIQQSAQIANAAVAGINQQLDQTGQKAANLTKVKDGMLGIANASQGVTFDAINTAIAKVGSNADIVKGKINQFAQSLAKISTSANVGSVNNYVNSLNRLASALAKSVSYTKAIASAQASIAGSFNTGSSSAKSYADAINRSVSASTKSANASKQNASAKRAEATAFAQSAARIREMSGSYNSMASSSASASAKIRSALAQQKQIIGQLQQTYSQVANVVSRAFTSMANVVKSRSSAMIGSHNSQKSAIDRLASAARSAKSAIENLNSSARNAMSTLNAYIAKARAARSAGSSVPSAPRVSANAIAPSSEAVVSAMSAFTASSGNAVGGFSGGNGGTSGIIRPSIYEGGINADGGYTFVALAKRKQSTAEPLPEKVEVNPEERQMTVYEGIIRQKETMLQRLNKASATYRNILKDIIFYENLELEVAKKELAQLKARNDWINKRLHYLGSLKKHTKEQREEYNKLQQEYDQNLSKIASLQGEIESITNSIRQHSIEMFTDFIDEIVAKYDKAIEAIKSKIDDIDFKIDVLSITQPDNLKDLLNLQIEKVKELQNQKTQESNKVSELTTQYESTKKKYGENSEQAKAVKEELDKAKEALEDTTLAILNAEKEIKDIRGKVADEAIKQLQDYYKNMKDMAVDAIETEKEALKKAHDEKMKMYDDEIEKINSVYDERLKAMDREKDEAEYQEQLDEKNAKRAELLNKISLLSRDNSLEGRKKLDELKKELADVEKDIAKFQKDHQDQLLRQSIEDQKKQQIDAINAQKEQEKASLDSQLEELDKEKEAISKKYDDLLNNEKYWADMRNNFIKGSFTQIQNELTNMKKVLDDMNRGIFDGLTESFVSFSEEVKKQIAEMNELTVDNMLYDLAKIIDSVNQVKSANPYPNTNNVQRKRPDFFERKLPYIRHKPTPNSPTSPTPSTPSKSSPSSKSAPKKDPNAGKPGYVQAEDGTWVPESYYYNRKTTTAVNFRKTPSYGNNIIQVLPTGTKVWFLGMENGWAKIRYNGKIGYVASKYLAKFNTGGYTGDWIGNDGRLAILHKKELVLNERQTKDILDTAKIIDKLKNFIPTVNRTNIASKLATVSGMTVTNEFNLTVNIENLNGNKEGANLVVKEIMKGLKKMGR